MNAMEHTVILNQSCNGAVVCALNGCVAIVLVRSPNEIEVGDSSKADDCSREGNVHRE